MKRRDFLLASAGALTSMAPLLARSQAGPCPPPLMSVGGPSVATECRPTALAQVAASLSPGSSSTSLGDTGLDSGDVNTIQWVNRFHYDHAKSRAHMLGKAASGGEVTNFLYNAASNTWSSGTYINETGHIYESIAYVPTAGELFTGGWPTLESPLDTLKKWTFGTPLGSWTNPATSSLGRPINTQTQPSICWHPNLFGSGDGGILALSNQGLNCSVVAWRRSNNQWYTVAGTSHGPIDGGYPSDGAIEYVRSGDYAIATVPPGRGGNTYRINAGSGGSIGTAVAIADVPTECYGQLSDYSSAGGILIDDPLGLGGPYILEKKGSNRVWKYASGNWTLKSYTHPFPAGSSSTNTSWLVASVYPLGVFWAKSNSINTPSRLWQPND